MPLGLMSLRAGAGLMVAYLLYRSGLGMLQLMDRQ
jgi:hypothetical protein